MDKMKFEQLETESQTGEKEKKLEEAMKRIEEKDLREVVEMELDKEGEKLGGTFSKFSDRIKKAVGVVVLGSTLLGANIVEARSRKEGDIGRAVERSIVRIIEDAAKGIGRAVENIGERMGGETPREEQRRIQEIQREDRDYHRQAEDARDNFMRTMQRASRGSEAGLGAEYREIAIKNYKWTITAINDAHRAQHFARGGAITGCRYPDGFSSDFVKGIEQMEKF